MFLDLNKSDLRYNSKILSFEYALSILKAKIASLIFLLKKLHYVNKKFFATCCVIVEAPLIFYFH